MSAVYPPGGTIVQSLKRTFADVPVDEANGNAVSTVEFLEASESLTTIFGTPLSQSSSQNSATNCAYRCHWWCCFRPRQEGYPWQRRGSSHHTPFLMARQQPRCTLSPSNKADSYLQKLRARHAAAPAESATVQDLVRNELKTGKHTATEGCLWLVRYEQSFPNMPPIS